MNNRWIKKAASSIHNITCQRKSNVLSIILYLKCMVQDIKWKNSMEKKNCKNRELQLWAICVIFSPCLQEIRMRRFTREKQNMDV